MILKKGLTLALGVATSLVILGSSGNAQEIRIGFVVPELSNELIANLDSGARQRAEELGNIEILTTGTNNGEDQARAVENYVTMGVDLIAYDTIDSAAIGPAIIKANEAGIPVVAIISKAVSGKVESYISDDFLAMGRVIGRWVGGELGPDGIIAHVEGDPADPSGVALTDGFVLGIKDYGISGLVAQAPSNWSRVDGLNNATNMLTANPNISGFYGIIDDVAMGIVEAARAVGSKDRRIIFRHLLPNILGPCIVVETLSIPGYILTEAFLSFIGLGANPPTPSWGMMISETYQAMRVAPLEVFVPATALTLTTLAFNFLGDGLRDAFDPRLRGT